MNKRSRQPTRGELQKCLTRTEARKFRAGWQMINEVEQAELRSTPLDQKFRRLTALIASANALGWAGALASEEAEVRERWEPSASHLC